MAGLGANAGAAVASAGLRLRISSSTGMVGLGGFTGTGPVTSIPGVRGG